MTLHLRLRSWGPGVNPGVWKDNGQCLPHERWLFPASLLSTLETALQTLTEAMLCQLSGRSLAQLCWPLKLSTTGNGSGSLWMRKGRMEHGRKLGSGAARDHAREMTISCPFCQSTAAEIEGVKREGLPKFLNSIGR